MLGPFRHLALVQPRVGIGDMVWHLPAIRVIAAAARGTGGRVTLVARPRSLADQLVGPADGIDTILWVERDQWVEHGRHQGLGGLRRLVSELRAQRFDAAILLTRSRILAFAAWAAGIPLRHGYGVGAQRHVLRGPFLPAEALKRHPFDQVNAWLAEAGIPLADPEPRLSVDPAARAEVRARFGPAPLVALGIGASDAWKTWSVPNFAGLAAHLLGAGPGSVILLGGPAEQAAAQAIQTRLDPALASRVVPVLGWDLRQVAALLAEADCMVSNDTAVLNVAAAVGTRAYGLFGATPVLRHSRLIMPIVPPGGPDQETGMADITLPDVLRALAVEHRDRAA